MGKNCNVVRPHVEFAGNRKQGDEGTQIERLDSVATPNHVVDGITQDTDGAQFPLQMRKQFARRHNFADLKRVVRPRIIKVVETSADFIVDSIFEVGRGTRFGNTSGNKNHFNGPPAQRHRLIASRSFQKQPEQPKIVVAEAPQMYQVVRH
ncbi:exonuclease subunit SbcD [Babesia caballi]|uniref:Exonuclease subunit SbcD n=1 Tax=Babesia caballi TaxID=5871 RepID=A0AAV4LPQ2_BABCB|nr:exonuclease subunit SbcD [Babesia caballi]